MSTPVWMDSHLLNSPQVNLQTLSSFMLEETLGEKKLLISPLSVLASVCT